MRFWTMCRQNAYGCRLTLKSPTPLFAVESVTLDTSMFKIAFDIGGTFTDFVLENPHTGQRTFAKVLSSHHDPSESVLKGVHRSEEHTSELQSLMRISYAVLCLKKTTIPKTNTSTL